MLFESFDLPILSFLNGFIGRSGLFDRFVFSLARYDIFKGVVMIALVWLAWFWGDRN